MSPEAQIADPTPNAVAANPSPEPAVDNGTVSSANGEAAGASAPVQETFTNLDPNTLPKELRSAYDNMLRDYKSKTMSLAEERKRFSDYDDVKQRAEAYEQLTKDEKFLKYWQEADKPAQNETDQQEMLELQQLWQEGQADPAKAIEFHRRVAQMEMKPLAEKAKAVEQKQQFNEAQEVLTNFANEVDQKTGQKLRPDYEELESTGLIEHYYTQLLTKYPNLTPAQWPKALDAVYNAAKKVRDGFYQKGYEAALSKSNSKIANSTERPSVAATTDQENLTFDQAKKLTTAEAVALAKKGKTVARSW